MAVQRRRWERLRKELDVVVSTNDGERLSTARTLDICEGGLGLVSPAALEVGRAYAFAIAEIDDAPLVGHVRWCTPSAALGGNSIGIELTSLTMRQTQALAERIARWRAELATVVDDDV